MKQPLLLEVPKDAPSRKDRLKSFCAENGIWTYSCGPEFEDWNKWNAMLMPGNKSDIRVPYQDCFKSNDPMEIIAGYCRVLEETGFLVEGKTEWQTVQLLCANVGIAFSP